MDKQIDALIRETSRIEEDALYSAKGHFEAASLWSKVHFWLGVPAAVLAAVAGGSILKQEPAVAVFLTGIVTTLTALLTFLNPQQRSNTHHTAAARFNAIRNDTRILREVDLIGEQISNDAVERLKTLSKSRDELNLSSPQIPRFAFNRARRGIESGEAAYAVDQK
jgi:SMODS and SLOG-associating 2TM effector domain family 4